MAVKRNAGPAAASARQSPTGSAPSSGTGRGTDPRPADGLIAVRRGAVTLYIHQHALAQHRKLGWVPAD